MNKTNKKAKAEDHGNSMVKKELSEKKKQLLKESSEEEEELSEKSSEEKELSEESLEKEDELSEESSEDEETYESRPKKAKWEEQSNKKRNDGSLQEELHFAKLFDNVLDIILVQTKVSGEEMHAAVNDIKEKFNCFNLMKVDFSLSKNLCAYFYRYSLLNAAISRSRISSAFNNCVELKECIKKSTLNIISLGGGPGTDMIGLCSALQEWENETNQTINLTIVDLCKRWASFYNVTEFFIREDDYGNITNFFQKNNICSSFMVVDLKDKDPPRKYCWDLKNADIVLLSRVLDGLNFKDDCPESILQNIIQRMKGGAMLLLIDSRAREYNPGGLNKLYESDFQSFSLTVDPKRRFYIYRADVSKAQIAVFKKNNVN